MHGKSVRGLCGQSRFIRVTQSGVNPEPRTVVDLARGGAVRPMKECEVAILNGGDNPLSLSPPFLRRPRGASLHTSMGLPRSPRILRLPVGRSHPSARSLVQHIRIRTRTPALIGFTQAGADVAIIIKA